MRILHISIRLALFYTCTHSAMCTTVLNEFELINTKETPSPWSKLSGEMLWNIITKKMPFSFAALYQQRAEYREKKKKNERTNWWSVSCSFVTTFPFILVSVGKSVTFEKASKVDDAFRQIHLMYLSGILQSCYILSMSFLSFLISTGLISFV